MSKKTVVFGASPRSSRFSYKAVNMLKDCGHEVVPLGISDGTAGGLQILSLLPKPEIEDVHTVTMYINPSHQKDWYDYIFSLSPERIIFNPGTENSELAELAKEKGVEVVYGCTLIMLGSDSF